MMLWYIRMGLEVCRLLLLTRCDAIILLWLERQLVEEEIYGEEEGDCVGEDPCATIG